jgi:hypothetical protein
MYIISINADLQAGRVAISSTGHPRSWVFLSCRLAALRSAVEPHDWDVREGQLAPPQDVELPPPQDVELPPAGGNVLEVMLHGEGLQSQWCNYVRVSWTAAMPAAAATVNM